MHGAEMLISSDLVKDYQALIGALIGFTGVICTMLFNSYLSRKQHERIVKHEAKAIKAAFMQEMRVNKDLLLTNIDTLKDNNSQNLVKLEFSSKVFDNCMSKIGQLTPIEIEALFNVYSLNEAISEASGCLSNKVRDTTFYQVEDVHVDSAIRAMNGGAQELAVTMKLLSKG